MSGARKSPVQQRSRETVEWIVEAAARVFDREGIDATTNRIAAEAGVSIGSLYQYFPNKYALLDELALAHLAEAEARLLGSVTAADSSAGPDLGGMLAALVTETAALHAERGGLHAVMRVHAGRSAEVGRRFTAVVETLIDRVERELRTAGVDDPGGRARLIVATVDAQVHGVLADGDPERRDDRLRLVIEQVLAVGLG